MDDFKILAKIEKELKTHINIYSLNVGVELGTEILCHEKRKNEKHRKE